MKTNLFRLFVLSLLAFLLYSAYRGVLWVGGWVVDERPHAQAADVIEDTLDKGIEATNDTDWVCRALEPKKK